MTRGFSLRTVGLAFAVVWLLALICHVVWGQRNAGVAGGRDAAKAPVFQLEAPRSAKIGSREFNRAVQDKIKSKVEEVEKGLAGLTEEQRRVVVERLPLGFGTLRRTKDLPAPKPLEAQPKNVVSLPVLKAASPIERLVDQPDFLPASFLEAGAASQRAVGRVAIKGQGLPTAGFGTGLLVAPTLIMTNNHVIPVKDDAGTLEFQLNYQFSTDGETLGPVERFEFNADDFFHTSAPLDYSIVRVRPRQVFTSSGGTELVAPGQKYGFIPLGRPILFAEGQLVNVVQHPDGRPKEIAIHANKLVGIFDNVIRYTADTEPGSSGSPVFNNSWVLIALHHAGGDQDPATGKWLNNEGMRLDKIVQDIRTNVPPAIRGELGL
jgi:V8-like Glu-specific endopeptidase